jgi:PhnB protein
MQFQPYLTFGGNCEEALSFYEQVLGAKREMMLKFKDAPPMPESAAGEGCAGGQLPPGMEDKIMHAAIVVDGCMLMASDAVTPYDGMKNVSVTLSFPTTARATEVFTAFSEGGKVEMPMGETFWVESFGAVIDRFGTSWLINGGKSKLGGAYDA